MDIGVLLPTYLGAPPDSSQVLQWARQADEAGFAALGVHDRPNHWTWEPLATLAAAASVTSRARLMTTALLLPPRPEALVAKQAALIDHLSQGRLDLGLALGGRADDYQALGVPFQRRGARFEAQIESMKAAWEESGDPETWARTPGPAPVQRPHPPLWIGGYADAAVDRAVRQGSGFLLGAAGSEGMRKRIPTLREAARAAGRQMPVAGLAYVAYDVGGDTARQAEQHLQSYYGTLHRPFEDMVHLGDGSTLVDELREYERAGVDLLFLAPTLPGTEQLERFATDLLPALQGG